MTDPDWTEVCVEGVDGESAEALSEIMGRYAHNGAVVERIPNRRVLDTVGEPAADDTYNVRAYVEARHVDRVKDMERAIWHVGCIRPMPRPTVRAVATSDWEAEWKRHHGRIQPGRRIVVAPPWDAATTSDELVVVIEPGMAFGVGSHPSTRHCLVLLEDWLRMGDVVLDVGSGSGVLSIAAARLGASFVAACDFDAAAAEATRSNSAVNRVGDRVAAVHGSLDGFRGRADVIVINIVAKVICALLPAAIERLSPTGRLVLSGILTELEADVLGALERYDRPILERRVDGDWVGLVAGCR